MSAYMSLLRFSSTAACLLFVVLICRSAPACKEPTALSPETVLPTGVLAPALTEPAVRPFTEWYYGGPSSSKQRVKAAERAKNSVVEGLFMEAGLEFPPRQLLLRIFKDEWLMEVWAADDRKGPLTHVTSYEICTGSGVLGPKRRQGDLQVPEGFYILDIFNPHSRFYLSMRINYPNKSDRILGYKSNLGNSIMIHGSCVSIGCLAMSDERIQEIWLITKGANDTGRKVQVHIFPSRDIPALVEALPDSPHVEFWSNLQEGYEFFDGAAIIPAVKVGRHGRYYFK